jgi:hypothetical protein
MNAGAQVRLPRRRCKHDTRPGPGLGQPSIGAMTLGLSNNRERACPAPRLIWVMVAVPSFHNPATARRFSINTRCPAGCGFPTVLKRRTLTGRLDEVRFTPMSGHRRIAQAGPLSADRRHTVAVYDCPRNPNRSAIVTNSVRDFTFIFPSPVTLRLDGSLGRSRFNRSLFVAPATHDKVEHLSFTRRQRGPTLAFLAGYAAHLVRWLA